MFASDSVSLPRLDNPTGACPTHRRQWADFLVSLMAPLHRQYKTARTETRWHLLLKIGQMPIQTSASRGYVLLSSAVRDTRESAHCLRFVGHIPWIVKTWKRHGIRCKHSAGRNAHIFLKRIFHLHFHMKSPSVFLIILLITPKRSMLIATIPLGLFSQNYHRMIPF